MIWDTAFEGTPAGSDFASVTSSKLRDFASLFETMISKDHTFDASDTPIMVHKIGYCSVIGIGIEDYDIKENGIGEKDGDLKHSDGVSLNSLGTLDHRELVGLTDSDTHTQYVKKISPVFEDVSIDDIQNVEVSIYPATGADNEIMSREAHKGTFGSEGVHHVDKCISNADITLSSFAISKIALTENEIGSGTDITYIGGQSVGSINCFYVDTNYKCYIDPIIDGSDGFKIHCNTLGTISFDSIEV